MQLLRSLHKLQSENGDKGNTMSLICVDFDNVTKLSD